MFLGRVLRVRYFVEGHVVVLIQFKESVHYIFRCVEGRFVDGAVVTQKELDDVLRNLADKSTELDEVKQNLTDKKSEVRE